MNKAFIHFMISAILGLGIGYLVFDVLGDGDDSGNEIAIQDNTQANSEETKQESAETSSDSSTAAAVSTEENILQAKGCLGCHAVKGLNLQGGATGPDLSQAFNNVEGKHGKPLKEFLKEPTSAVMSGVIGGNPLTEEEISKISDVLKQASESK
ncbi:c-type cytochrome [Bacillus sp. J33]|uniref:c-type cytochrome n=1 Tax=Bacillus sp. J33 TaxID=935836 RepID=UPI00047C32BF|nr:hypothetical protein [Bacillus sp. J33]